MTPTEFEPAIPASEGSQKYVLDSMVTGGVGGFGIHNSKKYITQRNISSKTMCHNPFYLFGATAPRWAMAFSFTVFLDHTQ